MTMKRSAVRLLVLSELLAVMFLLPSAARAQSHVLVIYVEGNGVLDQQLVFDSSAFGVRLGSFGRGVLMGTPDAEPIIMGTPDSTPIVMGTPDTDPIIMELPKSDPILKRSLPSGRGLDRRRSQ